MNNLPSSFLPGTPTFREIPFRNKMAMINKLIEHDAPAVMSCTNETFAKVMLESMENGVRE